VSLPDLSFPGALVLISQSPYDRLAFGNMRLYERSRVTVSIIARSPTIALIQEHSLSLLLIFRFSL